MHANAALPTFDGGRLRLLPERMLVKTGPVDFADWNYHGVLGYIQRRRFHLVLDALKGRRVERLLELGYGSGVFQPELARHCGELHGLDAHDQNRAVADVLFRVGVASQLISASADPMPYPSEYFDCVVAVSVLEFIDELDRACGEVARVLKPEGVLIVVAPGQSPILDLGLKLLTGQSAKQDFGDRRRKEAAALERHFETVQRKTFPAIPLPGLCIYTLRVLRKRRVR
ncbi:class I SAM-dependent methyltransferase [bacterium]|nr:class I SAM-dependent methyltransferase [bacterium]